MSSVISYRVVDVRPLRATGDETDALPRRFLGRVLTPQDIVNLGGFFEANDRVTLFHEGRTWVFKLENADEADEWNALPHGRDEGAFDTEAQMFPQLKRQFIP